MLRILIFTFGLTAALHAAVAAPITYQGQLRQAGGPVTGIVDMEFQLYDAPEGGNPEGAAVSVAGVPVDGGLFQVELDFGGGVPFEQGLWLQVTVAGEDLAPRQPITAAPLALRALSGDGVWTVSGASISYVDGPVSIGAFSGPARLNVRSNTSEPPFMARVGDNEALRITEQRRVGIGTDSPNALLHIHESQPTALGIDNLFRVTAAGDSTPALMVQSLSQVEPSDQRRVVVDRFYFNMFDNQGGVPACVNTIAVGTAIIRCPSSSERYKQDITDLETAIDLVRRLRAVRFRWKETGEEDIGLIAEEVAEIEPRLALYNKNGEIESVKYNHLTAVLVKAFQEQQVRHAEELSALRSVLEEQRRETRERLAALEALLSGDAKRHVAQASETRPEPEKQP